MVSLVPGLSVPGPKEGRGAGWDVEACRSSPSGAQPSPALPVRRLLQTDWLYSWTPGGRPGPPARDTLTRGWGTLHATITTHDARARTGPAGGGAWHSLAPGFG